MSTRSNIAIRLRPEDRLRNFTTPMGTIVNPKGSAYLYVYCHNDGYPSGVGQDLKDMFEGEESYEAALEYILAGDRSTTDLTYWEWRRESNVDPAASDNEEDMYQNDYLYIIEEVDGSHRLHVRLYGEEEYDEYDDDEVRDTTSDYFADMTGGLSEEDLKDKDNYELGIIRSMAAGDTEDDVDNILNELSTRYNWSDDDWDEARGTAANLLEDLAREFLQNAGIKED